MAKKTRTKPARPNATASKDYVAGFLVKLLQKPSVRIGVIVFIVLLAVAARLVDLGADPPMDVSWSHDLFTDPPQYTSYARNAVIFGQWNPLNDDRLVFFQKNITGVVAYLVFLLTGPGVVAGRLVAVLFNLVGIAFLVWGIRRAFGFAAAWATALFLSVGYLFVNYGRMPFLEVASNAALAIAFFAVIAAARHWRWAVVGGLAAGLGIFFGKVTALHAAPILLAGVALTGWQAQSDSKAARWARPLGFVAAVGLVFVTWYVFAYLPASSEVLAYLKEQSLALYGKPVGLTSLGGFIAQWFTFGAANSLLTWQPVMAVLGFIGMAAMIVRFGRVDSFKMFLSRTNPAGLMIVGWFWSAWAAFMPFNYRPVRYEIVLLYPLAAAAGWLIGQLILKPVHQERQDHFPPSWYTFPLLVVVSATGIQQWVTSHWFDQSRLETFNRSLLLALVFAGILSALWIYFARARKSAARPAFLVNRRAIEVSILLVLMTMLVNQGRYFARWWSNSQHSLVDANRDLQAILGDGAILTGGYGTALTQGARLGNFPAMFGVSTPDFGFFRKFPVTHVAEVDQPNQPFFRNYPDIVKGAAKVTTYTIRNLPVAVYRVSAVGGNPVAKEYQPSPYERLRQRAKSVPRDSLLAILPTWVPDSADCFSAWRWLGDLYTSSGRLDEALEAYRHASSLFADDFFLWAQIGDVSWEKFRTGSSAEYRRQAIDAWTRARNLNPRDPRLAQRLSQANGR